MKQPAYAGHRRAHRVRVAQVAGDELDVEPRQMLPRARLAHQRAHGDTALRELAGDSRADKPACACNQRFSGQIHSRLVLRRPARANIGTISALDGGRPLIKAIRAAQGCSGMIEIVALFALAVWIYLLAARGGFWLGRERDDRAEPAAAPAWPT